MSDVTASGPLMNTPASSPNSVSQPHQQELVKSFFATPFIWFRGLSPWIRKFVFTVALGTAGAFGTWIWTELVTNSAIDYEVDVHKGDPNNKQQDWQNLQPLSDVEVNLGINGIETKKTDVFGKAVWESISPFHHHRSKSRDGQLWLRKDGYLPLDKYDVKLLKSDEPYRVILFLQEVPHEQPVAPVLPKDPKPASTPKAPSGGLAQTLISVYKQVGESGVGSNFSSFYDLCSQLQPAGYQIVSDSFVLTGDRTCGAWAECTLVRRSPEQVCYKFRMQGHSEALGPISGLISNGNNGIGLSTGVLTVLWKKLTPGTN